MESARFLKLIATPITLTFSEHIQSMKLRCSLLRQAERMLHTQVIQCP